MVELIPKKQQKIQLPHWLEALFYAALVFFILAIIGFVMINRFQAAVVRDIQVNREAIEKERSPERRTMEASVKEYQKKINDFAALLTNHRETSKFLAQAEKLVHPRVWFPEISVDAQKMTVKLSGSAADFVAVGQQMTILQNNSLVNNVVLSTISVSREGEVQFSLSLSFDPGIFQAQ
ncbi:MAG: hypothetical protein A2667_03475 [Candidatus Wildermuthbacteria bacterium RIFCSPHIGHO2_01_FULL_47_27]|uniref:Fimbrial assembly protein n=2 Tax=Candidatus Wildermuthiibacteriota TaxID=1817923 RepID=A0A1G2RMM7_9BACT|nr:MAG: hypothetical protein UY15_C0008G0014 [Parcubacteria group bacterium GW2011_GWA2_47_9]OHA63527.1 MAG: hypothetical protein A2667_03475 [Candidatus Wildermuthbacteria bacterium RIFCSPHIGHO2_01_FULL_47_27]OHA67519.1 MAG: hypothetical protein A3D59_03830 [Candidatus Wildermuthbacteria bacterium RIFCSPHIGHO2_02_FULL_47_17]OHA74076.1 MAG: hypothetical protein A3A32_02170 [Candidatus Wildermuthbacteria bacterium RIFCSPLOWO2_01_FULL_48_35]